MRTRGQLLSVPKIIFFIPSRTELIPCFNNKFYLDQLVWESRRADAFEERIGEEFEEGRSKKQPQDQEGLGAHVKTNISNFSWNLVAHVAKCMQGSIKWKPWEKEGDHENGDEPGVGGGDHCSKWWPDTIRVSPRHWSIRLGSFCFTRICFGKSYTRFHSIDLFAVISLMMTWWHQFWMTLLKL